MPLALSTVGSGPSVMLLHGWTGFKEAWGDLPAAIAAAGMCAITVDLPGWGASPESPRQRRDAWGYADALDVLIDQHAPVAVIGHSMGGQVAVVTAHRWPGRISRLVLIATPVVPAHRGWQRPKTLVHIVGLPVIGRHLARIGMFVMARRRKRVIASYTRSVFDPSSMEGNPRWEALANQTLQGLRSTPTAQMAESLQNVARTDLRPLLGEIRCPTLVVFGERDRSVNPANAPTIGRLVPGAEVLPVERAAHLPFLERPETVIPAIVTFLS